MQVRAPIKPAPLMAVLGVILLFALWAGLVRLGWQIPPLQRGLAFDHGPLMVSGFLGSLILLERVVALRMRVLLLGPALTALGGAALIFDATRAAGPALISAGSLIDLVTLGIIVRREPRIYTIAMGLGVVAWVVGNLLWLFGWPVFRVVLWWAAFLLLTIIGERLELSRVLRPTRRVYGLFAGAVGIFLAGVAVDAVIPEVGARIAGVGLIAQALWVLRYDVAPRNLRHPNLLTRFIAWCLLLGYFWMAAAGGLLIVLGLVPAGLYYDAVLHSIFLGFVFSMIFGHAPIILPALLGVPVTYSRAYWMHLGLLHVSLLLRIASDLAFWQTGRLWGGMFNVVAVLLFLGVTAAATRRAIAAERTAKVKASA